MSFLNKMTVGLALTLFSAIAIAEQAADVSVSGEWGRALLPGQKSSAVYLSLTNTSTETLELVAVNADGVGHAMFHETIYEDGISKMRHRGSIVLEPNSTVEFRPGGLHIMLMGLAKDFSEKSSINLRLLFSDDSELSLDVQLRKP